MYVPVHLFFDSLSSCGCPLPPAEEPLPIIPWKRRRERARRELAEYERLLDQRACMKSFERFVESTGPAFVGGSDG